MSVENPLKKYYRREHLAGKVYQASAPGSHPGKHVAARMVSLPNLYESSPCSITLYYLQPLQYLYAVNMPRFLLASL